MSDENVSVTLSWPQMMQAAMVGVMRVVSNTKKGRQHQHGDPGPGVNWDRHIEGAMAEFAVAQFLGKFWDGNVGDINASDVGKFEVRSTHSFDRRLILHDSDNDDSVFISVVGQDGKYAIRGWIKGADGKKPGYFENPSNKPNRDAYFVPNDALQSISSIPMHA